MGQQNPEQLIFILIIHKPTTPAVGNLYATSHSNNHFVIQAAVKALFVCFLGCFVRALLVCYQCCLVRTLFVTQVVLSVFCLLSRMYCQCYFIQAVLLLAQPCCHKYYIQPLKALIRLCAGLHEHSSIKHPLFRLFSCAGSLTLRHRDCKCILL